MCIEINARNLIRFAIVVSQKFRNRGEPEMFLPPIFDSQACEKLFRRFRSMGTTNFTKINFSILELIHMVGRVEVQTDIAYCQLNIERD